MTTCEELRTVLDVFSDGELPAARMVSLQSHVDRCAECAELIRFHHACSQSLRQAVSNDARVSNELERRIRAALHGEAEAEAEAELEAERARGFGRSVLMRLSPLGTLAAAAAVALFLWQSRQPAQSPERSPVASASAMGTEELLDRLIDYHSAPPAPQVTEPSLLPELERDVGVKVFLPSLVQYGARWQGASVVRVRPDQRAAYLRYQTADDHSVTVYVYNALRMPLHAGLEPQIYLKEPVYVGHRRGYSIAAQLRNGVGYAVATDLDNSKSAELVHTVSTGNRLRGNLSPPPNAVRQ